MPLSDKTREDAERLVKRYPVSRSALLPLLHLVQSDQGYVSEEGIAFCAEMVGLTKAEVGAVATFYTMYKREPVGDYLLSVCTTTTCKFLGGQRILDKYKETLGGYSDPDTKVTVEHAECLGICDAAPMVQVNYEMFGPLTDAEADQLLESCRKGEPPVSPWSGEKPPTFSEIERDLSGANDTFADELIKAARQQVEYDTPPAYRTGETDIPVTHPGGDVRGVGGDKFREDADANVPAPEAIPAGQQEVATEAPEDSVAEERVDATAPAPEQAPDQPEQPAAGEMPAEAAGDEVTATDESQTARKVEDSSPEPETKADTDGEES